MTVTVIDQRAVSTATYRELPRFMVEVADGAGYGIGYGDIVETAYADARQNYQQMREENTRAALKDADRAFLAQMRKQYEQQ